MRRILSVLALALALALVAFGDVHAQVPGTVHASWNPNPAADAVTQYQVAVDGGAPAIVLPTACTVTTCLSSAVPVATFGQHNITLAACNQKIDVDPTSLQCGPALALTFKLGALPVIVAGGKITN